MLQTRVIVRVIHPKYGFVVSMTDRGAKFRDSADIARVTAEMVADAQKRHGQDAKIKIDTHET